MGDGPANRKREDASRAGASAPPPLRLRRFLPGLLVLSLACVERTIEVRSDPPGARVYLDREFRGVTPLRIPFHHYGMREVAVEKDGFAPQAESRTLWPPWYQIFPLDFVSECLVPFTLRDRRAYSFTLKKSEETGPALGEGDREALLKRAEEMRKTVRD
jgi:hypothetical protein